jgi:hypothetical protein
MLTIHLRPGSQQLTQDPLTIYWDIKADSPEMEELISIRNIDNIVYIETDGDELEFIKKMYNMRLTEQDSSIPVPQINKTVIWYGDTAKSIVHNLFSSFME